jgi:hypothetical protein
MNKLFCWPCLLFSESYNAWSSGNLTTSKSYTLHTEKTQIFCNTFAAHTGLLRFGHQTTDKALDKQLQFNKSEHNK